MVMLLFNIKMSNTSTTNVTTTLNNNMLLDYNLNGQLNKTIYVDQYNYVFNQDSNYCISNDIYNELYYEYNQCLSENTRISTDKWSCYAYEYIWLMEDEIEVKPKIQDLMLMKEPPKDHNRQRHKILDLYFAENNNIPYKEQVHQIFKDHLSIIPSWSHDIGTMRDEFKLKLTTENIRSTRNYSWITKNPLLMNEIQVMIDKWLQANIVQEIKPEQVKLLSPLLLIEKHSLKTSNKKEFRLCINFQNLNQATVYDEYPIPTILSELSKFRGNKWVVKLDLRHGYNNMKIDQASQQWCQFEFQNRFFQLTRLGFGFRNAPSAFQRALSNILSQVDGYGTLVNNYLDDIYIIGKTAQQVLKTLRQCIKCLHKGGLKIRIDKCKFMSNGMNHLGRYVNDQGISLIQNNVSKILSSDPPNSLKTARKLMGQMNWISSFIPQLISTRIILE